MREVLVRQACSRAAAPVVQHRARPDRAQAGAWPARTRTALQDGSSWWPPDPMESGRLSASRAVGAAGARLPDTEKVTGSNPVPPTSAISQALGISPAGALRSCGAGRQRQACRCPQLVPYVPARELRAQRRAGSLSGTLGRKPQDRRSTPSAPGTQPDVLRNVRAALGTIDHPRSGPSRPAQKPPRQCRQAKCWHGSCLLRPRRTLRPEVTSRSISSTDLVAA